MTKLAIGTTESTNQSTLDEEIDSVLEKIRRQDLQPGKRELLKRIAGQIKEIIKILQFEKLSRCFIHPLESEYGFPRISIYLVETDVFYDFYLRPSSIVSRGILPSCISSFLKSLDEKNLKKIYNVLKEGQRNFSTL